MSKLLTEVIQLTPEERKEIEAAIPKVVDAIKKDEVSGDESVWVTSINYIMASGEPAKVRIFYSDRRKGVEGMYNSVNPADLQDNVISLYKGYFSQYFGLKNTLKGTDKRGEDQIRRVLTHELVHAKDPALNHKKGKDREDTSKSSDAYVEAEYFRSNEEVIAFASQLNEIIIRNVKLWIEKHITDEESKLQQANANFSLEQEAKDIQSILREILKFFSGQSVDLSPPAKSFVESVIDQSGFEKFMTKIYNFLEKLGLSKRRRTPLESYTLAVEKIKEFNPEGYDRLLKSLAKTLQKLELSINVLLAKEFRKRKERFDKAMQKYEDSGRNIHYKPKTWQYPINLLQISVAGTEPIQITKITNNDTKTQRVIAQTNDKLLKTRDALYPKKKTPTTETKQAKKYTLSEAREVIKATIKQIYKL